MRPGVILGTVVVSALVLATTASAALPGRVVGKGSASGQFAIASANADVKKPKALYVRMTGNISNGTFIVGCSKGFSVSANNYDRNRAGLYRLPIKPARADNCTITAAIGGSGRIRVEIRAVT